MSALIHALPGLEMSVSELTVQTGQMWEELATADGGQSSDFRAWQMNLFLHFGSKTPVEEAKACFDQAIAFGQVYPCRIIVLSERDDGEGEGGELQGKLFSQCYLGKNFRDLCCCEALMLSYPKGLDELVAVQCSLWLETDLPVHYWIHRMEPTVVEANFGTILKLARRVVYDRSIEADASDGFDGLSCRRVHDITYARLLRIRQTIGQLVSAFQPVELVEGLESVQIESVDALKAEAHVLVQWVGRALERCFKVAKLENVIEVGSALIPETSEGSIILRFTYADESKSLIWSYNNTTKVGLFKAEFPTVSVSQPVHLEPVGDVQVLAEAFFF
jgi:hypothetical protein|tara:strand:+ start:7311 stop:8309 length:999 start_codon:yes stop_codon:yes gene_type:complete